jgi:hypothetical protein
MKISKSHVSITVLCSLSVMAACTPPASAPASGAQLPTQSSLDQLDICQVRSDSVAQKCKAGQKIVFLPSSWGSEQYPVVFAAANCDLRYSVAMTAGGVTCIYLGAKSVDGKLLDVPPAPKTELPAKGEAAPIPK